MVSDPCARDLGNRPRFLAGLGAVAGVDWRGSSCIFAWPMP